jgi:hypothetical protein
MAAVGKLLFSTGLDPNSVAEGCLTVETDGESYEQVRIIIREMNQSVPGTSAASGYLGDVNELWDFFSQK